MKHFEDEGDKKVIVKKFKKLNFVSNSKIINTINVLPQAGYTMGEPLHFRMKHFGVDGKSLLFSKLLYQNQRSKSKIFKDQTKQQSFQDCKQFNPISQKIIKITLALSRFSWLRSVPSGKRRRLGVWLHLVKYPNTLEM